MAPIGTYCIAVLEILSLTALAVKYLHLWVVYYQITHIFEFRKWIPIIISLVLISIFLKNIDLAHHNLIY